MMRVQALRVQGWKRFRARVARVPGEYRLLGAGAFFQLVFRLVTYQASYDYIVLLASAVNFLGRGKFATLRTTAQDLSVIYDSAVTHWPPGFSVAIVALIKLLGSPYAAMVTFDLISVTLFYAACGRLLALMGPSFPRRARLLTALTIGFFSPSYLEFFTNCTSLSFFLWALILVLPDKDGREPALSHCGAAGAIVGLAVGFRFAAAPVSVVPVLVLGMGGWRDRVGRRRALAAIAGWGIALSPLVWWKLGSSSQTIQGWKPSGFYPQSFARFHAFAADALFGSHLDAAMPDSAYGFSGVVNPIRYQFRHLLSALVLLCSLVGARRWLGDTRGLPEGKTVRRIFLTGGLAALATVAMLTFLTLVLPPEQTLNGWVYVQEARYFNVCLPFVVFGIAYLASAQVQGRIERVLRHVSIIVFILAGAAWMTDFPASWRQWKTGRLAGPVESHFLGLPGFVETLRRYSLPGARNALVEFAEIGNTAWLRQSGATYAGIPSVIVSNDERLHTTRDVNVIAIVGSRERENCQLNFHAFCTEQGSEPVIYMNVAICTAFMSAGT